MLGACRLAIEKSKHDQGLGQGETKMQTTAQRKIAVATLGVMAASTLGGATAVQAGSKGRLNTTIGLGAITAYGLLKKNKTVAIAGALGSAYAYTKYNSAKKQEMRVAQANQRRTAQWYQQRYGRNWRSHYAVR
jgi:hypothetical protein